MYNYGHDYYNYDCAGWGWGWYTRGSGPARSCRLGTHRSVTDADAGDDGDVGRWTWAGLPTSLGADPPPPSGGLEGGLYESEYVKEGGDGTWKWKLFRHRYFPF